METPDIELYATEPVTDGIRVYRSNDAVFETRIVDGVEARLYTDGEGWYAKARFPETEVEDAYNRLMEAAEDINDVYGTALDIAPPAFLEQAEVDGEVHLSEGRTGIHYIDDSGLDELIDDLFDEPARSSIVKGALASSGMEVGGGAAVGAGIGAAIGALGGPPGIVAGAATGAALGGGGMGLFAGYEGGAAILALTRRGQLNLDAGSPMTRAVRYFEKRRRERYTAIDAVEEHLASVNRLHSLEHRLESIREMDLEQHEELDELRDKGVKEVQDALMEVHFHRFEENEGASVVHEADTYEEARDFLTTAAPELALSVERPSFYTSPEAFKTMFNRLTYHERGKERYLDDASVLVRNVYDRDEVPDDISGWLERHHPGLVRDIGRERSMKGREQRHANRYGHDPDEDGPEDTA